MVIITGEDTITKIFIDSNVQKISKGPNQGQDYYRARHAGLGFTVPEDFYEAWLDGNLYEVNLKESSYEVEDPMNPGESIKRDSFQLTTWATCDQIAKLEASRSRLDLGRKRHALESRKIDVEAEVFEKEALAKFKLSDDKVAALQGD